MPVSTLTPWSRILLDKLILSQLVKFPAYNGTRLTLSCSQQSSLVPVLSQINPLHARLILFLKIRFSYYAFIYALVFLVASSLAVSQKPMYINIFSPIRATCPAHHMLVDLITLVIFGKDIQNYNLACCFVWV